MEGGVRRREGGREGGRGEGEGRREGGGRGKRMNGMEEEMSNI